MSPISARRSFTLSRAVPSRAMPTARTTVTTAVTVAASPSPSSTRLLETTQVARYTARPRGKAPNPMRTVVMAWGPERAIPIAAEDPTGSERVLTATAVKMTTGGTSARRATHGAVRQNSPGRCGGTSRWTPGRASPASRRREYEVSSSASARSAGAMCATPSPPNTCERMAPVSRKVNPAYAHSRSARAGGVRRLTTPSSLAAPSKGMK